MEPWWGAHRRLPCQHDPLVFTAGLGDSVCIEGPVEGAGGQDVTDAAGRGGGVDRGRNAGATPARNIVTTSTNGHRLSSTATSPSSVGLTGASSIAPSPRNASPRAADTPGARTGTRGASLTCCRGPATFLFGGKRGSEADDSVVSRKSPVGSRQSSVGSQSAVVTDDFRLVTDD